ncbi:MAG: hypothetical protein IJP92_04880 [Lachnospiraceae bacterium]|nr:hypothetical protein [Lachnospiraceae bacterium]
MKRPECGVPEPSEEQVDYYLNLWAELENYILQEKALNKLFHKACPQNDTIVDVLIKASTLNDFYSTNIYSIFPVAKHIFEAKIDAKLEHNDISVVDDIRRVSIGGKVRDFYSFATKYCSHHYEKDKEFPIYDSYVDAVLRYFRKNGKLSGFKNEDLKKYARFKEILIEFRGVYGLEKYSLKDIDKYLWQLGKDCFPKSY